MSLWRLEWLRLRRTWRGPGLLVIFLFFGFLGPVTARYLADILQRFGGDVQVVLQPPVPADGVEQYLGNVTQLGLLAIVAAAAGAFAFDGSTEIATFLRTRVSSLRALVWTRFGAYAIAAAIAWGLGCAAAWYETVALIGRLPAGAMLAGIGYGALYYAFAVALTALAAGIARGVLGTVMLTFAFIVAIALVGIVPQVGEWLPGRLAGAMFGLVTGTPVSDYARPALVAAAASVAALWASIVLLARREI
jgi:ABC-2 type transport system permease protein